MKKALRSIILLLLIIRFNGGFAQAPSLTGAPSANADLSSLALSAGSLTPVFRPSVILYSSSVTNSITSTKVTLVTANANATAYVNGVKVKSGTSSNSIPLNVGSNTLSVLVNSQNNKTIKLYTIIVTRAANADLSNLTLSNGTLVPVFASATITYTANVGNVVSSVKVTPVTTSSGAMVTVNGAKVKSGSASGSIALGVGSNTINVIVTAQDNKTTKTYTVNLTRAAKQTITFAAARTVNYGAPDFAPGATSTNSTIPITYASSNTAVATISNEGNIHIVGAGISTITASQAGNTNYEPATPVAQKLTVNKAPLTITAINLSSVYGAVIPGLSVAYNGFVYSDNQTVLTTKPTIATLATTTSAVGTYPITVSGAAAANYTFNYIPGTLTVTPANVTVTANSQTAVYGAIAFQSQMGGVVFVTPLSLSFSGFVNGDTPNMLITQPIITTTASANSVVGTYPIIASGATSANYTFNYVPGIFTVTPAILTVTADNQYVQSGSPIPLLTVSYSGFVNADTPDSLAAQPVASTTATESSTAGTYPITPGGGSSASYTFSYLDGVLTIANPVISAPSVSYNSPQTLYQFTTITPIVPANSGLDTISYNNSPLSVNAGSNPLNPLPNLNNPTGIAVDNSGELYIADSGNNQVRTVPAAGGTTPAILGSGFSNPTGVARDREGNLLVVDAGNDAVKKILNTGGAPVTIGSGFNNPTGIAVDSAGNVYVADSGNNAIKMIPSAGGSPVVLGSGFSNPTGVAVDAIGNVYVADFGNSAVKMIPTGGGAPVTLGSAFIKPWGVGVDCSGNVYVSDQGDNHLKLIRAVSGSPMLVIGSGFDRPSGITVDGAGNVYVADSGNNAIKEIMPTGGYFISPALPAGLTFDNTTGIISGTPTAHSLPASYAVTLYNTTVSGNPIGPTGPGSPVNQFSGTTLRLAVNIPLPVISYNGPKTYTLGTAITPLVPVTTGMPPPGYGIPITLASGFDNSNSAIESDRAGNVYVTDDDKVYKIPVGGNPQLIGSGFNNLGPITIDRAGNVFVGDQKDINAIYKLPEGGGAPVVVGHRYLNQGPEGLAVDAMNNIYANGYLSADVEKYAPGNLYPVSVVNTATSANDNTGLLAISVDAAGNVYVGDYLDLRIKKISAGSNTFTTVDSTDFSFPRFLKVDSAGNIFVQDAYNMKMIPTSGGPVVTLFDGAGFSVALDSLDNIYQGGSTVTETRHVGIYTISPALPKGLIFDSNTGIISGTPATLSPPTNYRVTGFNDGGGDTTTIRIEIAPVQLLLVHNLMPNTTDEPVVRQALSPNGDGLNDVLRIDNIENYPDNKVTLTNSSGAPVYQVSGYDNVNRVFNGYSNITGKVQRPGTYYYELEYSEKGALKRKVGYFVIKY